jgi:hypothetical protein
MTDAPYLLPDYLADHYGTCALGQSYCGHKGCNKYGWRGRACPNWQSIKATDYKELMALAAKQYDEPQK